MNYNINYKRINKFICAGLLLSLVAGLSLTAHAQTGGADLEQGGSLRTESYYIAPVENSGVSGNVQIVEAADGGSAFIVTLKGIVAGSTHALTLFEGDCGPDRRVATELNPIGSFNNEPFASITTSDLSFETVAEGDYFVYAYADETMASVAAACGEVGVNANAATSAPSEISDEVSQAVTNALETGGNAGGDTGGADSSASGSAVEGAPEDEFTSPRAASYALSPVAGSGISGNLQVSEEVDAGTRLTVTLTGIPQGGDHAVALFEGDCGPDRQEVAQLNSVNAADGNPNASITDSDLSFEAIAEADHFLYVYAEDVGSEIVACGEVGLGANP